MKSNTTKAIAYFSSGASFVFIVMNIVIMPPQDMVRWVQRTDKIEDRLARVFSPPDELLQKSDAEREMLNNNFTQCNLRLDQAIKENTKNAKALIDSNESCQSTKKRLAAVETELSKYKDNSGKSFDKLTSIDKKITVTFPERVVVEGLGWIAVTRISNDICGIQVKTTKGITEHHIRLESSETIKTPPMNFEVVVENISIPNKDQQKGSACELRLRSL